MRRCFTLAARFAAVATLTMHCMLAWAAPAMTTQDLETFFDGLVPFALQRADIAGGVVAVVQEDRVLFAKGYGYADVERRTPVTPDGTLFRPGSISKLFTWTAVMQQVEQGKLDLDSDVNQYLDFTIPVEFGKPVTLRHLMTHTPGFEDANKELFVAVPEQLYPLGSYLKKHVPRQIHPPGEVVAYSNYGTALAGYIVERVAGEPYERYIQEHILQPLRMLHSTVAQPLPAELQPLMSQGYRFASDRQPRHFELVEGSPAGALSATASDMARFMIAYLNGGELEGGRILQPRTVDLMHANQYRPAPAMNGFALGFYEQGRNGLRIIGHGGDTSYFHSDLSLLPTEKVGLFISLNSMARDGGTVTVRAALSRAFLDRYFPYTIPSESSVPKEQSSAGRVAGWYLSSRRMETGLKLLQAVSQARVAAAPDGTIEVSTLLDFSGTPKRWREVQPLVYRELDGQARLVFEADADGRVLHWTSDDDLPVHVWQPVKGMKQQGLVLLLLPVVMLVLLASSVIWVVGAIKGRRRRENLGLSPRGKLARRMSRVGTLFMVAGLIGWPMFVATLSDVDNRLALTSGEADRTMYVLFCICAAALLGAVAILANTLLVHVERQRSILVRFGETVLMFAALYGTWFILTYRLASFDPNF